MCARLVYMCIVVSGRDTKKNQDQDSFATVIPHDHCCCSEFKGTLKPIYNKQTLPGIKYKE